MKQLEIKTNKRLLIVEFEKESECLSVIELVKNGYNLNYPEKLEVVCKGSDLTDDIACEIVDGFDLSYFVDYNHHNPRAYKLTALESFISAIESKGFIWGVNKVKYPNKESYGNHDNINILDDPPGWDEKEFYEDLDKWQEAESRTFNPSKCIIFEIV